MMKTVKDFVNLAAASLAEDEYWYVEHPDGPLPETASKVVTLPVVVVCEALGLDWDDATEQGYYLSRGRFAYAETADAALAAHARTVTGKG